MHNSRLPISRTATKRIPPDFSSSNYSGAIASDSPTLQKAARVNTKSPAKSLALPPLLSHPDSTPASARMRMSLAPSVKSPFATPPRRAERSNRLSIYGVPMTMAITGAGSTLHNTTTRSGDKRITVCARKRPLSKHELSTSNLKPSQLSTPDCIIVDQELQQMKITVERTKLDGLGKYADDYQFSFDCVFDGLAGNALVYRQVVSPLISFVAGGGKATCFAYGQTGSGKSHTMFHPADGICFLGAAELVEGMTTCSTFECCLVSFFEIYQGHLYDLLQGRRRVVPCEKSDGQVKIMGLSEVRVRNRTDAQDAIQQGLTARVTGKTGANSQSSRSHAILQFTLVPREGARKDRDIARMSFIDLAGSERGADRAEVDRKTKLEGSEINKSLLALKECIRAIDMDAAHLPFRQSKLTLVLKDSFIGNVKTAMIATVSPAAHSSEHTLNTLRYAERFHEISLGSLVERSKHSLIDDVENCQDTFNSDWAVSANPPPSATKRESLARNSAHAAAMLTPVKTVTFGTPSGESRKKEAIAHILGQIRVQVEQCHDADVLELLEEELRTLSQAFESLC